MIACYYFFVFRIWPLKVSPWYVGVSNTDTYPGKIFPLSPGIMLGF
jgi:hypothetical protein